MIGIFDSGVGGLSVWRHIRAQMPNVPTIYVGDQAHVPYGPRPAEEIIAFSSAITDYLLEQGATTIVVACNTATAAAINHLRQSYPDVPFVGMEPAVKPAVERTRSGLIGVLATAGTFESQRYAALLSRFAQEVTLLQNPCVGLVELIEEGKLDTAETETLLRNCIDPMLTAGIDTLILGCTHYPFVMPLIEKVAGPDVTIIDPAPAVARQTERVYRDAVIMSSNSQDRFSTTGDLERFKFQLSQLIGAEIAQSAEVYKINISGVDHF